MQSGQAQARHGQKRSRVAAAKVKVSIWTQVSRSHDAATEVALAEERDPGFRLLVPHQTCFKTQCCPASPAGRQTAWKEPSRGLLHGLGLSSAPTKGKPRRPSAREKPEYRWLPALPARGLRAWGSGAMASGPFLMPPPQGSPTPSRESPEF